jgi:hypothetical protein
LDSRGWRTLNSLFGISFVVTWVALEHLTQCYSCFKYNLSIPFLGFLLL